ncbi:MAG: hypothetical protein LBP89_04850 [Helicobacteraceae bacterium]|jgi:hypothetical protein|nr:hypothetical protein [Helicobacteraceae bacterium]
MLSRSFLIAVTLLSFILSGCAIRGNANVGDPCLNFGDGIKIFTELEHFYRGDVIKSQLDLNGDGIADRVVFLPITKQSKIAKDVTLTNPYADLEDGEDSRLSDIPHLAVGIIHSATKTKPCEKYIIYNNALYGEWSDDIEVLKKIVDFSEAWAELARRFYEKTTYRDAKYYEIKYDAIEFAFPKYGPIYLFWDGKRYKSLADMSGG